MKLNKPWIASLLRTTLICVGVVTMYHLCIQIPAVRKTEAINNNITRVALEKLSWDETFADRFYSSSPTSFIEAAKTGKEAVVFIKGKQQKGETNFSQSQNSGSGVILSNDGYIVTNQHVTGNAEEVMVVLSDKRIFTGKVIGSDLNTDLALIKIESEGLPFLVIGNSDSLQIGEWVLAIGNPFNLQSTVTAGIVSAKTRNINLMESQGIESFIQTDAAVNPGSSGGALVNTAGLLVGINTAIISETGGYEGFSFAIPANVVKKVVADLKEFGVVQRGWLGIEIEEVDASIAAEQGLEKIAGVMVSSIMKDGAAQLAGMKQNDVIVSINDYKISNTASFMEKVAQYRPGEKLQITIWRNKKEIIVEAILKNHLNSYEPVAIYKSGIFENLGIEVRNLDGIEKTLFGKSGVFVVSIKKGSIIYQTKMEPGFIIKEMDGIKIKDAEHLKSVLTAKIGKQILWEGIYKNYPGTYPYVFEWEK